MTLPGLGENVNLVGNWNADVAGVGFHRPEVQLHGWSMR